MFYEYIFNYSIIGCSYSYSIIYSNYYIFLIYLKNFLYFILYFRLIISSYWKTSRKCLIPKCDVNKFAK